MSRPDKAVSATRTAVRASLEGLPANSLVLVGVSGGADSLALAAATAWVAGRVGLRAGAITVDHGLQGGSAERAAHVADVCRRLGLDPVEVVRVEVGTRGGPEAAARNARRAAFESARERLGAAAILVGHTLDDQAETVILGLARGSGARSLSGMARESRDGYLRPFLGLERANTRKACAALGLEPWEDPHNEDRTYARVRVRLDGLPSLEGALGPGVAKALARSADLLRADADALDDWANLAAKDVAHRDGGYDCFALGQLPRAVRTRIIRRAAITAGAPAASLSHGHIGAIDALVTGWRGQGPVALPGRVRAWRRYGRLLLAPEEADHQQGDLDEAEDGSQRPSPKE